MKNNILKKSKSYLMKIFAYFVIVLLVPIVTIIILNIKSQSMIREQILLSNQNTMQQVFELIDTVAEEMRETCIAVSNRSDVLAYATSGGNSAYARYLMCDAFSIYKKEKILDVFVYFPQDNYIVSGTYGSLTWENYYEANYSRINNMESFYQNLQCTSGYPVFSVINPEGEEKLLCVTMRYKPKDEKLGFVVSIVVRNDYLNKLLGENNAGRGGTIVMFDKDQNLLIAGESTDVRYNMEGYSGDEMPYEVNFDGKEYVMQVYSAKALKGYYAFVTPTEFFWEQLSEIRVFSLIGICACVLMSILLVIFSGKRVYDPVEQMMDKFRRGRTGDYNARGIVEFEFLDQLFQSAMEEKQFLRETKAGIRERFLVLLLEGNAVGEGSQEDLFEKNGIQLCSDRFIVGIIRLEQKEGSRSGLNTFVIGNVFEEIFGRTDKGYLLWVAEGKYVFLLNLANETDVSAVAEMLDEGKTFLADKFDFFMTIAYSRVHEGLKGIRDAYQEAQRADGYRYILGKGNTIAYSSVVKRKFDYLDAGQARLSVLLEDYLNQESREESVEKVVSKIFSVYRIDSHISLDTVECFKFDVINAVNRAGLQCGYPIEERQQFIYELLDKDTLAEFREAFAVILTLFRQKMLEKKSSQGICRKTKTYIEENFANTQLSLSFLEEEMGMSASHLSKLYKEAYGVSVPHEITAVRLRNAKLLLQNTDININDVAERSGFSNASVLIRTFKKWEGITPGRYRELL